MIRFDVETHCWLYNDDLDWFWKQMFHSHHKRMKGGGISENLSLPSTVLPAYLTIRYPLIWINSPYLKETDKQKILSFVGKTVITTR